MTEPVKQPMPLSRPLVVLLGIAGVCLVGAVDYLTGVEISFSIFYLIPVAFVGWASGPWDAALVSLLSAIFWYFCDVSGGSNYSHALIPVWNAVMRFGIFLTVGILLPKLNAALRREKEARAAAASATEAKSNFMANMTHELRTPLNAIVGVADVLANTPLNAEQRRLIELLIGESEQLRRLVNDILDLSKLEAGRMPLKEAPFRLRELVASVCNALAPMTRAKGLALEWTVASDVGLVWLGDEFRLREILSNLIGNAVKFTTQGRVQVRVETPPAPPSGMTLRFAIADTGPGILPEDQTDLFERFSQGGASFLRRHGGSGLGLSIVKGLVERMNGRVWFTTTPGQGTTFYTDLPLAQSTEAALFPSQTTVSSEAPGASIAQLGRPLRVLLVEDYEPNRRIVREYLKGPSFEVETCVDGAQGLEKFKAGSFDFVLMDMNLPVMDGLTATRAIREWERSEGKSTKPIIALTASVLRKDRDRCMAAGCSGFLPKPIRKAELLAAISQFMGPPVPAPQSAASAESSVSTGVDPEIAPMIPGFLKEMREHSLALRDAAGRGDLETVRALAHQCAGAGGCYGFKDLSVSARAMEEAALIRDTLSVTRLLTEWENQLKHIESVYE